MEAVLTGQVIDRDEADTIFTLIGANRVRVVERDADRLILTPASTEVDEQDADDIDPDDYDNDTDYINAIPGMAERLLAYLDLPDSEFEDWDD